MVGFGKTERPPVSHKSSLPHPTIESEVTVASLCLVLNKLFFLFFRRIPTEREIESERERESGIGTSSRSQNCLPVENGAFPYITIILQELIVEFNSELFTLWSNISVLCDIVLTALIEHQLSHIYGINVKVKRSKVGEPNSSTAYLAFS